MKYIFPRQFGLHNVFTSKPDVRETVQPFKEYVFREDEIARLGDTTQRRHPQPKGELDGTDHGPRQSIKIPKRLRGMTVELVQKLQSRNKRCAYKELLSYYCPLSVCFVALDTNRRC